MKRLHRYVFRETLGPLALGFLVYTFILLMRFFFDSAEMIIRRDVPVALVGKILALNLPHIVVLTIPMALLFGILIAIGRLAADSELIAMRASGVSLLSLYVPVVLLSILLTICNSALMILVLPWGNYTLQQLNLEIITRSISQEVKPRVFYEEWEDKTLYVFDLPPAVGRWNGVFLAQAIPGRENKVTVAQWGEVRVEEDGEQIVLQLEDSVEHQIDLRNPEEARISHHKTLGIVLEDRFLSDQRARVSASKTTREMTLEQLRQWVLDPEKTPEQRRLAEVEIHKKFAIPVACLVLGLFAVPLGLNNQRGGKSSGFALSIGVILVYYIVLSNAEEAAVLGRIPPALAMWTPNFVLTTISAFLIVRKNRDKGLLRGGLLSRRVKKGGRESGSSPARAGHSTSPVPERPQVLLRLPRLHLRFPNLLDRYILRLFARVFVLALLAGLSVYVIADFTELVDEVLKNKVGSGVVLNYYKYFSLQIFYLIAPVIVLITTLITFSLLSRTSEVTAAKALGMSLFRLAIPAAVASLLVASVCVLLESSVLPATNARAAALKREILGRENVRTYRRANRQWLYGRGDRVAPGGEGGYLYNYLYFDPPRQTLHRLQAYRFDADYSLTGHLYADRATYADGTWWVVDGWARTFAGEEMTGYEALPGPQAVDLPQSPEFFHTQVKQPDEMNYVELREYIRELVESGQSVPELEVQLHNKIALPFVCLVMGLVGLPFAFRVGNRGALYGLGLALVLGMVFYAIVAFFTTLGEAGGLPPMAAVWSPNVLFGMLSLYLFLGVRT